MANNFAVRREAAQGLQSAVCGQARKEGDRAYLSESYLGANALEAEFREQKFDMIRQCSVNLRLIEMWISCSSFSRPSLTGVASKFWPISSR
jgi:hypothetical protein